MQCTEPWSKYPRLMVLPITVLYVNVDMHSVHLTPLYTHRLNAFHTSPFWIPMISHIPVHQLSTLVPGPIVSQSYSLSMHFIFALSRSIVELTTPTTFETTDCPAYCLGWGPPPLVFKIPDSYRMGAALLGWALNSPDAMCTSTTSHVP